MTETLAQSEEVLEVISPDGARKYVRVTQTPFLLGRGAETGNHLQLTDRRISRNCGAIVLEAGRYYLEDRGARRGIFVNGEKVESRPLNDGDVVTFGLDDSYQVIFRSATGTSDEAIPQLLTRTDHMTSSESTGGGLRKLNLLLEATTLLHSQLPLDSVLAKMIDHAIAVTDADRGLLEGLRGGHKGLSLQGSPDEVDQGFGEMGQVGQGPMANLCALAVGMAEQVGHVGL